MQSSLTLIAFLASFFLLFASSKVLACVNNPGGDESKDSNLNPHSQPCEGKGDDMENDFMEVGESTPQKIQEDDEPIYTMQKNQDGTYTRVVAPKINFDFNSSFGFEKFSERIKQRNSPSKDMRTSSSSEYREPLNQNFPQSPSKLKVKGFHNLNNSCYINSTLQALYSLVGVREYVFQYESNNMLMTTLMHIFYQLYRNAEPQNVSDLFLPVAKKYGLFNEHVKVGGFNDSEEACRFIIENIEPLRNTFFVWETTKILTLDKITLRVKPEVGSIFLAQVRENPNKLLHEHLETQISQLQYLRSSIPTELLPQLEEKFNGNIPDEFSVQEEIRITKLPPVLAISAAKFDHEARNLICNDIKVSFERTFTTQGKTYHLVSYIVYKDPVHYVCRALYDLAEDLWAEFDDTKVTPLGWNQYRDSNEERNSHPYLFFYVEEGVFMEWKQKAGVKAATKNIFYSQTLQSTFDLIKVMRTVLQTNPPSIDIAASINQMPLSEAVYNQKTLEMLQQNPSNNPLPKPKEPMISNQENHQTSQPEQTNQIIKPEEMYQSNQSEGQIVWPPTITNLKKPFVNDLVCEVVELLTDMVFLPHTI